ncbi:hypothetical protein RAS2_00290 [Phycisphaerae bacterium RAS2]|nr:hypothetical protein RAS2_00290 [Phycisphaerae bacterium RAS2]
MGGSNSGWHGGNGRPQRKARVDECPVVLSVKELERRWPLGDDIDGWLDCGIRYELRPERREEESKATAVTLMLFGSRKESDSPTRPIELLTLTARSMPFGPDRWHFLCPLCNRPARKLYIPPVGAPPADAASGDRPKRFACRSCHNLTYDSVQTHDPRISRLRGDPDRLAAVLDSAQFIDAPPGPLSAALWAILR